MTQKIISQLQVDMQKKLDGLKGELAKLRTGRAHPAFIEHIKVEYYGNEVPITQVASVVVGDPRTLVVTPWEKPMIKVIDKAILNAGLGLNPVNDGNVLRIPMPQLTEDRRREMVKIVKNEGESARVNVRNLRRDANNAFKDMVKKKEISEDDERRSEAEVQKITDKFIADIDKLLTDKEKELMTV